MVALAHSISGNCRDLPYSVYRLAALWLYTTAFITSRGLLFRKWSGALNEEVLTQIANDMLEQEWYWPRCWRRNAGIKEATVSIDYEKTKDYLMVNVPRPIMRSTW